MGITGTDVSKEAADMVLLDDNFATIVHAVEEGRTIYENIRKFVRYIMSSNIGEIVVIFGALMIGFPVPLTAVQILWINLITDGLPGVALGVEPPTPDVMERPPHPPNESVLARGMGPYMLWVGVLIGGLSLLVQYVGLNILRTPGWQTMVFTVLCFLQMGNALAVRSDRHSLLRLGLFTNPALVGAVALTLALQLVVIYVPFLQSIFGTQSLGATELGITLAVSPLVLIIVEISKWVRRRRRGEMD